MNHSELQWYLNTPVSHYTQPPVWFGYLTSLCVFSVAIDFSICGKEGGVHYSVSGPEDLNNCFRVINKVFQHQNKCPIISGALNSSLNCPHSAAVTCWREIFMSNREALMDETFSTRGEGVFKMHHSCSHMSDNTALITLIPIRRVILTYIHCKGHQIMRWLRAINKIFWLSSGLETQRLDLFVPSDAQKKCHSSLLVTVRDPQVQQSTPDSCSF